MVIQNNLVAMNAQRQYKINTDIKRKSTEKLSSGYRINRAADDAAGLTISEKMRSQIRGLHQASDNCQDGVSLCQVADGALAETHEILQRMHELSIKSANGTNTDADREAIQQEVKQLTDEFDRIANNTTFNEELYPLKGTYIISSPDGRKWNLSNEMVEQSFDLVSEYDFEYNGKHINVGDSFKATGLTYYKYDPNDVYIQANHIFKGVELDTNLVNSGYLEFWHADNLTLLDLKVDNDGKIYYENDSYDPFTKTSEGMNKKYIYAYEIDFHNGKKYTYLFSTERRTVDHPDEWITDAGGTSTRERFLRANLITNSYDSTTGNGVTIQAGSKAGVEIPINFVDATKKGLKLTDPEIDVSTRDGALSAIGRVKDAIGIVSGYRSYFGATQNRLEHTIANLDNVVENTQAAESRIRDTDMATEMVLNTKQNVLEQAITSMMSQANQSAQGVLALLQ